MRRWWRVPALLVAFLTVLGGLSDARAATSSDSPAPTTAAHSPHVGGGKGVVHAHDYGKLNGGILYTYLVYTPLGWTNKDQWPLLVVLHGCGSSAEGQMSIDRLNALADRDHFVVLRPDNQANCWRAVSDDALIAGVTGTVDITRGGGGDADIVAGMTKEVIRRYHANRNRVYIMGFSSGAFQASATAAAYPDLFAGASSAEGGGPGMAITCVGYPQAIVPKYAAWTVHEMGRRAHVMPFIAVAGNLDPIGEAGVAGCSRLAFWEWVSIDNMLTPSPSSTLPPGYCAALPAQTVCRDSWAVNPSATVIGKVPNGHEWIEEVAAGSAGGCEIAQNWAVDGMAHDWSGGRPTNSAAGVNTEASDPQGPNLSQLAWRFFSRFTLAKEYAATTSAETACSTLAESRSPDLR